MERSDTKKHTHIQVRCNLDKRDNDDDGGEVMMKTKHAVTVTETRINE